MSEHAAARAVGVTHVMAFSEVPGAPVFSGAENHLFVLMAAQRRAGYDVRLIMIVVHDGPALRAKAARLREEGISVEVVHHRLRLRRAIGAPARLAVVPRVGRLLRARPSDVVHTHLPQASQIGRLSAGLVRNRRIVDSVHSDDPMFLTRTWRLRLRLLDRVTGAYIAISGSVRRLLVEGVGLAPSRVWVVPYGVAAPDVEPSRDEARARLSLDPHAYVVAFVGRLTPAKDLPVLLSALVDLPDVFCVVIGGGEQEAPLRELARRLDLRNVRFTGPVPDAASLMRAFDVFCLPSRWEGLGLVLLEAMWREVPIVASDAGAIPEVLAGGRCGALFPCGDAKALTAAIAGVRADPGAARERAAAALDRVRSTYSVEAMLHGTAEVYERL